MRQSKFEMFFSDVVEFIDDSWSSTWELLISRETTSLEDAKLAFEEYRRDTGDYEEGEEIIDTEDVKQNFVAYGFWEWFETSCWSICPPNRKGAKKVWYFCN